MNRLEMLKMIRDGCDTVPELVKATGLSAQNVRWYMQKLKEAGWVTSRPQPSRGRGNPGKIYEFNGGERK